jgi:hypothetical protein
MAPAKRVALALLALSVSAVFAATALAHEVSGGTATCTGGTANFVGFNEEEKPITWNVAVDNAPVLSGVFTFAGEAGTLTFTFASPLAAGDHVVAFDSTWPGKGADNNGAFMQAVHGCAGPPVAPTPTVTPTPMPVTVTKPSTPGSRTPKTTTTHRRFGKPGKPTKKCGNGRRQLKDSQGRRFTVCRKHLPAPVTRTPHFTG